MSKDGNDDGRPASRSGHGEEADLVLMIVDTLLKMPYDKASMKTLGPFVKKFQKYVAKYKKYKDVESKQGMLKKQVIPKGKQYAAALKLTDSVKTIPNLNFFDKL